MNISRHIHLSLYGAAMLGLAACSESDTPLAPDSESGTELAVSPAPLPGLIVFHSSLNGQGNRIYVMNAEGTGVTVSVLETTGDAAGTVAVSVTEPEGSVARAVNVCATAV